MTATKETTRERSVTSNPGRCRQICASLIVSGASCNAGMFVGWLSPMSLILLTDDSPVETLSKGELATLGSLPSYAGVLVAFFLAYVAKAYGRKPCIYTAGIVGAASGVMLTFAPTKIYLFVGRTLGSIGVGAISAGLMYSSEIVHDSIRGTMLSLTMMFLNGGILFSYIFGSILSYKAFNAIFIILPLVYTSFLPWIPESPHFLMEKGKLEEAKRSLLWLRGGDHLLVELELDGITAASTGHENLGFFQILTTKSTRLALIISTAAYAFQTISGVQAILNYAGLIFQEAGSVLSPETCSIITGVILTSSCFVNLLLIDRFGRKPLLYVSFVGGVISLSVLSAFLYVKMKGANVEGLGWIPIGSLSTFMVVYGVGVTSVPGAISNEISPTSIRPTVNGAISVFVLLLTSAVVQTFPFLDDRVGLYSVFALPVGFNLLGILFTWVMVPETKGKSFVEIETELNNW